MRSVARNDAAWADLSACVDWNQIRDAHRSVSQLAEHDFADLATMTVAAAKRWAPGDVGHIGSVEQRFLVEIPEHEDMVARRWPNATKEQETALLRDGARLFKGFVDVQLTDDDDTVVDWKTASDLGPMWRERLRHSWQAKLYCWANSAKRFVFRGVQRDGRTAEVTVEWPVVSEITGNVAFGNGDAESYVRQAFALRESQTAAPWLQHAPWACNAFGRRCDHWEVCQVRNEPLGGRPTDGPLSYSAIESILLCPERYRRDQLLAVGDAESDTRTALGRAFHVGMASLYTQLSRI